MKICSINSNYRTTNYANHRPVKTELQRNSKTNVQNEISFGSKAFWKGLGGVLLGTLIAGPIGGILAGATGAGYGAIEDKLDEDKKNGIDWDQMPHLG